MTIGQYARLLVVFSHHIGIGEVIHAEVWGIYIGLTLAADLQVKKILIESDSAIVVNIMNSTTIVCHPLGSIIGECRVIMQGFDRCLIHHVHRERNIIVDALAKGNI